MGVFRACSCTLVRRSSLTLQRGSFRRCRAGAGRTGSTPACVGTLEQTLTSTRPYENPYADVMLRVRFTGRRAASSPPTVSGWRHCVSHPVRVSDSGHLAVGDGVLRCRQLRLHQRQGTVDVTPYRGENLLYRRGFLKEPDRRYLIYGDGTPFFWMGDTAWATSMRSSDDEWNRYSPTEGRSASH